MQRFDRTQALLPLVQAYLERQRDMELLDSWIERIRYFLEPTIAPYPFITPISLHIPDDIVVRLPPSIRLPVLRIIADSFNADNCNVDDLQTSELSESTAYLQQFERDQLTCLLDTMSERLAEMEHSEQHEGESVQHPESKEEWDGGQERQALLAYDCELEVLHELQAMEEWCEKAMAADVDVDADGEQSRLSLEKYVKLAELLVDASLA